MCVVCTYVGGVLGFLFCLEFVLAALTLASMRRSRGRHDIDRGLGEYRTTETSIVFDSFIGSRG